MEINLQNVEEIIFLDKTVQERLPEFRYLFDQFNLAQRVSGLGQMAKHSAVELLNKISEEQIARLEIYFGEPVFLNRLNNKLVDHYDCPVDDTARLCEFSEYGGIALHRKGDALKFTFWR